MPWFLIQLVNPSFKFLSVRVQLIRRLLIHHMDRVQPSAQRLSPEVGDEVGAFTGGHG
jgi:hypothetical protein